MPKRYTRRTKRARRRPRKRFVPRTEVKFKNTGRDAQAFSLTWEPMENSTTKTISAVKLDPTENGRLGRAYYIHSIHVNGELYMDPATSLGGARPQVFVRLSLVLDKQTNNDQLCGCEVYDETGSKNWLAFRNLKFTERFQILKTQIWILRPMLTPQGTVDSFAAGEPTIPFTFNHQFRTPLKVLCNLDPDLVTSITDNSLHLIGVASSVLAKINMTSRCRFTD